MRAVLSGLQQQSPSTSAPLVVSDAPSSSNQDLGWRSDFNDVYMRGKLVGAGSFGQVHMGIHQESGIEVAVKTLPKIRGRLSREATLEKIKRETDMMERLQGCAGVIRLLELFEDENTVQIVTELCPGGDLQKFVEKHGPLDERSLAQVAYEVLKMVKCCHDLGVMHGDVKPANFCLKHAKRPHSNGEGKATWVLRAIDFGCSQPLPVGRRLAKRTGTPVFMAPEIFRRDYSTPADIWSIGVMLYWLFCRRFPFFENAETVKQARLEEVSEAVTNGPIDLEHGSWSTMSPEGLDFIRRCLTRPEKDRITVEDALQHSWFHKHVPKEARLGAVRKLRPAAPAA